MVLSPGAGIASAAGKSALHASAGYSRGRLCKCRKRFSAGVPGAKPPAKKTYSLPLPRRGRGLGGWGQKSKLKAGLAGDKQGKPPAGRVVRPPSPVPPGFGRRAPVWQGLYVPQAVQCRGAGGGSPRQNKLIVSPFPGGEGGGGMGAEKQTKGRADRQPRRQAPLQIPEWHGQPATKKASPLPAWQKTPPHSGTPCGAPPQGGENAESSG